MRIFLITLALVIGLTVFAQAEDYHHTTAAYLLRAKQTHLFIRPIPKMFEVDMEIEGVFVVWSYLIRKVEHIDDDKNHYWTSSDTMFERMSGDCEDWAMLLVAMLRFSTSKPISADNIWVIVSHDMVFGMHAWVMYVTSQYQIYSFDLTKNIYARKGWMVHPQHMLYMFNDRYSNLMIK